MATDSPRSEVDRLVSRCLIQGERIPSEFLGPLRDSTDARGDGAKLRRRFDEDGYLFLRAVRDIEEIEAARIEVFQRLVEVGEIKPPAVEGIATGTSRRKETVNNLGEFWQSVSEGTALRRVSHGLKTKALLDDVFGEPMQPHDYIFLRPGVVGRATHLHYDYPFFSRGSQRVITAWTALGEIPVEEGPLLVLEGSNRFDDLIDPVLEIDYESKESPKVQMTDSAVEFARERGSRLLTTDFQAGDVILFSMTTMHGTLDNHSPIGRTRLSCDVRWQPAADPFDPRYMGPNPPGTTGAGYGELNGAKPLTEDWHIR